MIARIVYRNGDQEQIGVRNYNIKDGFFVFILDREDSYLSINCDIIAKVMSYQNEEESKQ